MSARTPLYDRAAQAGAVFQEEAGWLIAGHYGDVRAEYEQARQAAALFDVSHHGKIELTGPHARSFLQNLCTNDIKTLTPGTSCEAFLTTNKAKVVAYILVVAAPAADDPERLLLVTEPGRSETVLKHLDRYLISEQVELADRTAEYASLHLAGPQAEAILSPALESGMALVARSFRNPGPLGVPGYDLICLPSQAAEMWQALTAGGARPAGLGAYELLRVEAGTPVHGRELDDDRFVVEVGRGTRAICYTKGCYLGQEPIVMARDRGHVNRWLVGLKAAGSESLAAGARVFRDGQEVGQVTSAVQSPRLGAIALAYVRRGSHEPGTAVEVDDPGGRRRGEVAALPQ